MGREGGVGVGVGFCCCWGVGAGFCCCWGGTVETVDGGGLD